MKRIYIGRIKMVNQENNQVTNIKSIHTLQPINLFRTQIPVGDGLVLVDEDGNVRASIISAGSATVVVVGNTAEESDSCSSL